MSENKVQTVEDKGLQLSQEVIKTLASAKDATAIAYPVMLEKSQRAAMALSVVTKIETQEDYEKALVTLGRVKLTFEFIEKERKAITGPIDALKPKLMEPEKKISTDPNAKESEYYRVKSMCDRFMQDKLNKENEDKRAAINAQRLQDETIRLVAMFKERFAINISNLVLGVQKSLDHFLTTLTAENFEEKVKIFNVKPAIKSDVFESWFALSHEEYDQKAMTPENYMNFLRQVREQYNYEHINGLYIEQVTPVIENSKAKLPELKVELIRLSAITDEAQKKAEEERLAAKQKEDSEKEEKKLEQQTAEKVQTVQNEAASEKLNNAFDTQLSLQAAEVNKKGTRTKLVASYVGAPADIVKTMSQVMYACFLDPKFTGLYKREKGSNEPRKDALGVPVLSDWADELLTFFAANCSATEIKGIELNEQIKSTVKTK